MHTFDTIKFTTHNRVATITLDQVDTLNAVSQQMRKDLIKAIRLSEDDDNIRIVVVCAEGRGFSSGANLEEGLAGYDTFEEQCAKEYMPILLGIAESTKTYIASIHGACAGIGASIAMSCDLGLMSEDAYLYIPFANIALVPDGGMSHFLFHAMGYKRAYQTFLEGGRIQADLALSYGLVNKVVPTEKLQEITQAWAETLSEGAPLAQKYGKQIFRQIPNSSFKETVEREAKIQTRCLASLDCQNAIRAFFNKTTIKFIGK